MTKQIFLPSDGPTGTPSLRTLGTGALQAAAGNDSRLSDTRTPTAHASTHDVGGSDVLKDLTRLAAGPAINGYTAWNYDPAQTNTSVAPTAGIIFLHKILTAHAYTVNTIDFFVNTPGTGATALANCFFGIYDSGGTRRFLSADQSSNLATGGTSLHSLTVSGGYVVTANDFIYIAFVIGTQSTTNLKLSVSSLGALPLVNANLSGANLRAAQQGSGLTTLASSLTLSSNVISTQSVAWFGVK